MTDWPGAVRAWTGRLLAARGMTVSDLARATGRARPDVSRSLRAPHAWTLDRVADYAAALGVEPADLLRPRPTMWEAYETVCRPLVAWARARARPPGIASLPLRAWLGR